ncbi:hypothetical protein BFJ72_g10522 [Fusarium proliferatum]|uniref:F-box domain-containing protein n=1 Tax=Gibberella intermedia TaxID=948311 RepID=A0A420STG4_GIBIN|nr:hypothetical protein BFJ72_g10522 [Fusarium proliferatum]
MAPFMDLYNQILSLLIQLRRSINETKRTYPGAFNRNPDDRSGTIIPTPTEMAALVEHMLQVGPLVDALVIIAIEDWDRRLAQDHRRQFLLLQEEVLQMLQDLKKLETIKPRRVGFNDLPDEILMSIFHNIYEGTDKPSLFAYFALRQVCQRFRRLTQDEAFDSHLFSDKGCCELCVGSSGVWAGRSPTLTNLDLPLTREKHCFGYKAKERGICLQGLEHLVRKGKTCYTCQKGFDARKRKGLSLKCKFAPRHYLNWSYCISCLALHPLVCFSDGKKFACLAKTGYIRLCEHKVIDWYFVQQFVNGRDSPSNQSRKFEIMRCEDPSHYSPCSNGLGGPKAEIITYATATGGGLLLLTFTGNSDPDLAPDQSICDVSYGMIYQTGTMNLPMRVIEEAVRSVREKGGKHFAPERISGVLPELNAFNLKMSPLIPHPKMAVSKSYNQKTQTHE